MPEYRLSRNYLLRTVYGHVIRFTKGEPVYVPPLVEKEAIAIGAERVDGGETDPLAPEAPATPHLSIDERRNEIVAAFELLTDRNEPRDFTGAGIPTIKAVEKVTGFDTDASEVRAVWAEWKASKAG